MMEARQVIGALGLLLVGPVSAVADTLLATRTIRAAETILAHDVEIADRDTDGALSRPQQAVGLEARRNLYAGRPILHHDVGPPAVVGRNDTIALVYRNGGLTITTDGRALDRAGVGDRLRVMSLSSRQTLSGVVHPDGFVIVGGN